MAKFKVGDKAKILDGSNIENYTHNWVNCCMDSLVGTIITISGVKNFDNRIGYAAKENVFTWDERGLELVERKNYTMTETTAISSNNKRHFTVTNYYAEHFEKYDTTYIRTILGFADGSKESVECPEDKFDAYYGFVTCYAKHMAKVFLGKNISDMADYWIIRRPKQIAKERVKEDIRIAEEKRIAERDKKRREKQKLRMEAIRRKEAYEAAKLAEEKYGVPADWSEK